MITKIQEKSDRSFQLSNSLTACIERFTVEIASAKARLNEIRCVKFYTSEIKKEKAKIEADITYKTNIITEIKSMEVFKPGLWVRNGSNNPGKVIELRIVGSVPEVQVQWWGSTVSVPERPAKLTLVDEYQLEYIWNGDRIPKLVRRLDLYECDEIEILSEKLDESIELRKNAKDLGNDIDVIDSYRTRIGYLKKRIAIVNREDLERLERVVRQGLDIFYRVGEALAQIRDRKLYKDLGYSNFRDYLTERWDMKKSQAYRLIDSAEVVKNLSLEKSVPNWGQNEPIAYQLGDKQSELLMPKTEAVAREVGKAPVDKQSEVWEQSIDRFGDNPTAKQVKEVVAEVIQDSNCTGSPSTLLINCTGSSSDSTNKDVLGEEGSNDARVVLGRSMSGLKKLAEQFKPGQLVKLDLSNFSGVAEELRLCNHSFARVESITSTKCNVEILLLEQEKTYIVSPQDLKLINVVDLNVSFDAEQFLVLMSTHKSKDEIINVMRKGVLNK